MILQIHQTSNVFSFPKWTFDWKDKVKPILLVKLLNLVDFSQETQKVGQKFYLVEVCFLSRTLVNPGSEMEGQPPKKKSFD